MRLLVGYDGSDGGRDALLAEAQRQLEGPEVETRAFGGGSAAGVMTDLAERRQVDSIVVGSLIAARSDGR